MQNSTGKNSPRPLASGPSCPFSGGWSLPPVPWGQQASPGTSYQGDPPAPHVQRPSSGPLPTGLGPTPRHACGLHLLPPWTVPVTVKRAVCPELRLCAGCTRLRDVQGDSRCPGSRELLLDLPTPRPGHTDPPPHRHCVLPITDTTGVCAVCPSRSHTWPSGCPQVQARKDAGALPHQADSKEAATGRGRRALEGPRLARRRTHPGPRAVWADSGQAARSRRHPEGRGRKFPGGCNGRGGRSQ